MGVAVQSVVPLFTQSVGCSLTCLMRRKKGRYFGMCARNECKLQVELGGSLTLYKETMYTEKANSVSSCVLGQTHENRVNAAQKGDPQQWPLVQISTREETSAQRSAGREGKRELHVVRQQERLPKEENEVPTAGCQNRGHKTQKKAPGSQWG